MNEGLKFLKYGRHVKSEGKPSTYREHISKKKEMAGKMKLNSDMRNGQNDADYKRSQSIKKR